MWHDVQLEHRAIHRVHRQAGAIHRDRTFVRDIARQLVRRTHPETHRARIIVALQDLAQPVHVSRHQVSTQAGLQGQRLLQVHPAAGAQAAQRGQ